MLFLCSSAFGSRAQLGRRPSRGVTSWRPTNRAGNVKGVAAVSETNAGVHVFNVSGGVTVLNQAFNADVLNC